MHGWAQDCWRVLQTIENCWIKMSFSNEVVSLWLLITVFCCVPSLHTGGVPSRWPRPLPKGAGLQPPAAPLTCTTANIRREDEDQHFPFSTRDYRCTQLKSRPAKPNLGPRVPTNQISTFIPRSLAPCYPLMQSWSRQLRARERRNSSWCCPHILASIVFAKHRAVLKQTPVFRHRSTGTPIMSFFFFFLVLISFGYNWLQLSQKVFYFHWCSQWKVNLHQEITFYS